MSYCAYVAKIKDLRKHSNADRLQVGQVFGNQVIVGLNIKDGDIGIYFPTDGKLGMEFANINNLVRKKDANGNNIGGYLDPDKRHISSLKLRGEFSDGLFMPLECLSTFTDITKLQEGDTISTLNNVVICEKYVPQKRNKGNGTSNVPKKKKKAFVFFEEHIDTEQLAYNKHQFKAGDLCYITLKMHGTSARTSYTIEEFERKTLWDKLLRRKGKMISKWNHVSGTRRTVLDFDNEENKGFYNNNEFRRRYHDLIMPKLKKGENIYYEIVGYVDDNTLIMSECSNKKTNDKDFVKQYGETTKFTYGCGKGESAIYVYRMSMTNEDGYVVEYPQELVKIRCEQMGLNVVPELDKFIFTTEEDLMQRVEKYCDGADPIGLSHIREGVVVRIDGKEKFKAFKHKNIWFKILEGIIKADAVEPDMEEAQEVENEG